MRTKTIILGGLGFIGYHCTLRALTEGHDVTVVDDFSRAGALANLAELRKRAIGLEGSFEVCHADIRSANDVDRIFAARRPQLVIHLAAQVAVTASLVDPRHDFEVNALGTLNVLEAVRCHCPEAFVVFSSTNKVYGGMEDVVTVEEPTRYRYRDYPAGVDEKRTVDFHSPYGCSKGAADQYVHDYHRIYGLRTTVFRQSCIYGTNQFGIEDQGWVAWFSIAAVLGRPFTIYGTGKQVRDLLWIDDLCDAYWRAWRLNRAGRIYNMGGGNQNMLSLLELLALLGDLGLAGLTPNYGPPRPGDQPVYVANTGLARRELDWHPQVDPREGVGRLVNWVKQNSETIRQTLNF